MGEQKRGRPTIGVLVSWPTYNGTSILHYQQTVLQGIYSAAVASDCNLLLACGIDAIPAPFDARAAWPLLGDNACFVPVGPWNTDGLIVLGIRLFPEQEQYLRGLADAGHALVYAGFAGPGVSVHLDNRGGIRQALEHLRDHGHRRVAFIAGLQPSIGESGPRLEAYLELTRSLGLASDPRLIAHSELRFDGGQRAMRQILAGGAPFSAVLASNDSAAIGAASVLKEHGLRIPEDIALIGFDDVLEARSHIPALTTLYNPAFTVGRQAVRTMLELIAGRAPAVTQIQLPVRLVVRGSCGCRGAGQLAPTLARRSAEAPLAAIAEAMAVAVLQATHTRPEEVAAICRSLAGALLAGLATGEHVAFEDALLEVLQRVDLRHEDAHAWQAAIETLGRELDEHVRTLPQAAQRAAAGLIEWAQRTVGEQMQQQAARVLRDTINRGDRLGLLTAQLLTTLDSVQIPPLLAEHLPQLDIPALHLCMFATEGDDPVADSELVISHGPAGGADGLRFPSRMFPPPALRPSGRPYRLVLLPLFAQEAGTGYVAFDAANLEPCALLVRNLAAALRGSHLYAEAQQARRTAEQADRLKTMLLTNVGHELRTPLNIILGYTHASLDRLERGDAGAGGGLPADLRQIARSGEHLLRLINDLLDLSRAEIDELHLLPEPIATRDFLEAVFQASTTSFGVGDAVSWQLALPEELPWIEADPVRLRQALLNLLHNAHKFTSGGQITLGAEASGPELHLWVTDTGAGIPAELREQIFDPFVSVDEGHSRREGIGLGLAITRRLVALHHGRLSVESQVGAGSTFHLYLPLPALELGPAWAPQRAPQIMLVIGAEAEPPPRLAELAARRGLGLVRLDPTADPVATLQKVAPALVAWDLATATGHGLGTLDQLRRHPQLAQTPIVLYNSAAADDDIAPATSVLMKPVGDSSLLATLDDLALAPAAGTILIVEDDRETRALHQRLIAERFPQHTIVEAGDGRAALALLAHTLPSLIVLDLIMPELDGFGVLEALRAEPRTANVPVLVLSGRALASEDLQRLGAARVRFQTKGLLSADELDAALRRTLAHAEALPPQTSALVKKAIAFIHQHHAEALSLQMIAAALGVSTSYLGQIFRQEMGLSPWDYLIRYRVLRAKELLLMTDATIAEVASTVGFETASYFSRVFHREVGRSPRAFRAQGHPS